MILKIDLGKSIQNFTSSGSHITVRAAEFGKDVTDEERLHHSQNGTSFLGNDVTHGTDHAECCFFPFRVFIVIGPI